MAPFNNRQIGYIQAIAGRQQHVTLIAKAGDVQLSSKDPLTASTKPQNFDENKVVTGGVYTVGTPVAHQYNGGAENSKSLLLHTFNLDDYELGFDSRDVHNNDALEAADFTTLYSVGHGLGASTALNAFDAPCKGTMALGAAQGDGDHHVNDTAIAAGQVVLNPELIPSTVRATSDGFLNSTDLKFRFTLPQTVDAASNHPMGQDHYEFRWIVWRSKRPTMHKNSDDSYTHTNMEMVRDGCSFRHAGYDLFSGYTGRKRGFLGYTLNQNLDKDKGAANSKLDTEKYSGFRYNGSALVQDGSFTAINPDGEEKFTVDDLMTMRLNKDDYVIMKDVRFFLGKEHGKSHFEDHLHWDWNDPIDTEYDNVLTSPTLNNKSYRWHMTLLGTTGTKNAVSLNCSYRLTTKMESG